MEPATPLISDHTENDNNFKILKYEPSNFILQLEVLNSFSLSKGTKIKIDQFGLVEGSLRNMRDGITYFGYEDPDKFDIPGATKVKLNSFSLIIL